LVYKNLDKHLNSIEKFINNNEKIIITTMKEIEQSNVKSFIKKMKKSIEISYKKNVVELGNQMLNIKYNIQNFSTYDRITEYLSKQKSILGFHLKNNMMEDFSISIDFVLKPIFDLVNAKLNEYPNVLQVFIFAINIYKITYEIFSDMEIFDLKKAKIDKLFEELYKGIEKANFSEFQKKGLLDKLLNKDTFSIKYFLEFLNLIFIEDLCSNE
jgi:hypothetical protein